MLIDLGLALGLWAFGFAVFGRFIAPRWKVAGKLVFYLAVTALLHAWVGHAALIWVVAHPTLGLVGHAWWCRTHNIDWLRCTPRERYLALRPWAAQDGFINTADGTS